MQYNTTLLKYTQSMAALEKIQKQLDLIKDFNTGYECFGSDLKMLDDRIKKKDDLLCSM